MSEADVLRWSTVASSFPPIGAAAVDGRQPYWGAHIRCVRAWARPLRLGIFAHMGSAWLGLVGAIIGGLVSLIGTLATSRFQWRQEIARLADQRERESLQWERQRETDLKKRQHDSRDEQIRWLRDQKLKCYLEALNSLKDASEFTAKALPPPKDNEGRVSTEDKKAIVQELRNSYRWTVSVSAVCGDNVAAKLDEFQKYMSYIIQSTEYSGIKGGMIKLPPERKTQRVDTRRNNR